MLFYSRSHIVVPALSYHNSNEIKEKRQTYVAVFIDLAVIFTSAGSTTMLVGSAGSVLSAIEKKKRCKSN